MRGAIGIIMIIIIIMVRMIRMKQIAMMIIINMKIIIIRRTNGAGRVRS